MMKKKLCVLLSFVMGLSLYSGEVKILWDAATLKEISDPGSNEGSPDMYSIYTVRGVAIDDAIEAHFLLTMQVQDADEHTGIQVGQHAIDRIAIGSASATGRNFLNRTNLEVEFVLTMTHGTATGYRVKAIETHQYRHNDQRASSLKIISEGSRFNGQFTGEHANEYHIIPDSNDLEIGLQNHILTRLPAGIANAEVTSSFSNNDFIFIFDALASNAPSHLGNVVVGLKSITIDLTNE